MTPPSQAKPFFFVLIKGTSPSIRVGSSQVPPIQWHSKEGVVGLSHRAPRLIHNGTIIPRDVFHHFSSLFDIGGSFLSRLGLRLSQIGCPIRNLKFPLNSIRLPLRSHCFILPRLPLLIVGLMKSPFSSFPLSLSSKVNREENLKERRMTTKKA